MSRKQCHAWWLGPFWWRASRSVGFRAAGRARRAAATSRRLACRAAPRCCRVRRTPASPRRWRNVYRVAPRPRRRARADVHERDRDAGGRKACLSMTTCADLLQCGASIPPCAAGTGGTSGTGTGGTSGTAGNSGGGGHDRQRPARPARAARVHGDLRGLRQGGDLLRGDRLDGGTHVQRDSDGRRLQRGDGDDADERHQDVPGRPHRGRCDAPPPPASKYASGRRGPRLGARPRPQKRMPRLAR